MQSLCRLAGALHITNVSRESNAALRKQPTDWLFLAAGVIARATKIVRGRCHPHAARAHRHSECGAIPVIRSICKASADRQRLYISLVLKGNNSIHNLSHVSRWNINSFPSSRSERDTQTLTNFTSRGECCAPLLPYGLSSPTRNRGQSSYHAELTFRPFEKTIILALT